MRFVDQLLVLALLALPASACGERDNQTVEDKAHMRVVVIPVEGMACGSCAARIRKALAAIDGVGETDVSVGKKTVVTHYDPRKLSPERLAAAINGLGFKAGTPVETTP